MVVCRRVYLTRAGRNTNNMAALLPGSLSGEDSGGYRGALSRSTTAPITSGPLVPANFNPALQQQMQVAQNQRVLNANNNVPTSVATQLANAKQATDLMNQYENYQYQTRMASDPWDKIALGLNLAGISAGAGSAIGPAVAGAVGGGTAGGIAGGATAGAVGGALGSQLTGASPGKSALIGGIMGGVGGGLNSISSPVSTGLTNAGMNPALASGLVHGVTGAGLGALGGAIRGGNPLNGAITGGVGGAASGALGGAMGSPGVGALGGTIAGILAGQYLTSPGTPNAAVGHPATTSTPAVTRTPAMATTQQGMQPYSAGPAAGATGTPGGTPPTTNIGSYSGYGYAPRQQIQNPVQDYSNYGSGPEASFFKPQGT